MAQVTATNVNELTLRNVKAIAEVERASERNRTLGERMADGFAIVIGSWTFLVIQSALLAIWVVLNVLAWSYRWDPYPFILLNLALSFQAAYASPIIMMSQNRQSQLADKRNRLDLQINMLSEQENTQMLLCSDAFVKPMASIYQKPHAWHWNKRLQPRQCWGNLKMPTNKRRPKVKQ